ncbi:LTA synthase family protein [Dyella sp.]|uniref:LTA synthase family protein n=1 Tax=Dyella sp. TaxID=1869338 RepID=UPI002ED30718
MPSTVFRAARGSAACLFACVFFAWCAFEAAAGEPGWPQRGFILALMICTFGALAFALARVAIALVLSGALFLLLRVMSVLKLRYLDSPLMASDFIYYARTSLLETLRHYPHLFGVSVAICLVVPPMLWLVWRHDWRLQWRNRRTWRVCGTLVCVFAFWGCLSPAGPFAVVHRRDIWDKLSDEASAQLTNFFVTFSESGVQMPAQSSEADAEKTWASTAIGQPATAHAPYPDIIEVLEESTFDPADFEGCDIPQCHVKLFQEDARTRSHGYMRVHTWGGGTWMSEFAALTGMPHDIFGPAGMYAPFVLAPHVHDALPLQLQRLGYLTIAVYPTNGNFLNGRNAYHAYGFDRFFDAQDLKLDEWEETDAQMFDAVKRAYAQVKKPGQPVFVMVLTLNQHGPHDTDPLSTLSPPFNQNPLKTLPDRQALNFVTYLARLHDSDTAMTQLEHDFLDRPDPTMIVQFGDHQPSFSGVIRDMKRQLPEALRPQQNYLTYYMLKSNFNGPALPKYPALDIAYLPTMVLQAAGLPADPYFSASIALRDKCNGTYADCKDQALIDSYHAWIFQKLHVYQ